MQTCSKFGYGKYRYFEINQFYQNELDQKTNLFILLTSFTFSELWIDNTYYPKFFYTFPSLAAILKLNNPPPTVVLWFHESRFVRPKQTHRVEKPVLVLV